MRRHRYRALLLLSCVSVMTPAYAQAPDAFRQEMETLRQQFLTTTHAYEQRLKELSDRLEQLEGTRPPLGPTPAPIAPPAASPGPSLADLATPRQPFALASPGRGLLFDIGVSGDFVADVTPASRERQRDGTFAGRENRFFTREVTLGVFGRVDPYASAVVRISAGEQPAANGGVRLDAANLPL